MQVEIKSGVEGAKEARGIAVIIDIIHASSTIVELFENGAKEVKPVETLKEAQKLKEDGDKICGEWMPFRKLDIPNSPFYPSKRKPLNKVIINTKNGTRGILNAKNADEIVMGSFLNAEAVADYIRNKNPEYVTLIPMGSRGHKSIEDEEFALYLSELIRDNNPNPQDYIDRILSTKKNKLRLMFFGRYSRPCFRINTSKIVPILRNGVLVKI